MPQIAAGSIADDPAGDVIQTRDVEHRRHHANVRGSHVGFDIAGGQCGDHQFWKATGERAHGRGRNRRTRGAAQRNHSVNGPLFKESRENCLCPGRHGGDASTSVSLRFERGEILVRGRGHLCSRDVGLKGWIAKHTDIDHQRSQARALNPLTQEGELFPLGVERADQRNGLRSVIASTFRQLAGSKHPAFRHRTENRLGPRRRIDGNQFQRLPASVDCGVVNVGGNVNHISGADGFPLFAVDIDHLPALPGDYVENLFGPGVIVPRMAFPGLQEHNTHGEALCAGDARFAEPLDRSPFKDLRFDRGGCNETATGEL